MTHTAFWQLFPARFDEEEPWQGFYKVERHKCPELPGFTEGAITPLIGGCLIILGAEQPCEQYPLLGEGETIDGLFDATRFRGSLEVLGYLYRLYRHWAEHWDDEELKAHPFVKEIPALLTSLGQWLTTQRGVLSQQEAERLCEHLIAVQRACGLAEAPEPSDVLEDLDNDQPF
ncbi:MAG: hypothetical protein IRZ03_12820 [Acidobacterium ailaaui]|nr:hypothetical protein [Pseudacidobacterium ailaaui]